ncbi:MAG: lysylphosphatidylglycerol synthase domain-containing protein [Planctomycetota bacterium]
MLDRVAGLLGLVVLAAIMGPLMWDDPTGQKIALFAWSALVLVVVGAVVYVNPLTRKLLGLDMLTRLSVFQKIDDAVRGYRDHLPTLLATVGLSVPVHLALSVATGMAGYAIGVPTPMLVLITALPIVFIVGALPLTFMGLGVMEPTAIALLTGGEDSATANQVIAMLMAWRAYLLAYAIIGGAVMLGKGMHLNDLSPEPTAA